MNEMRKLINLMEAIGGPDPDPDAAYTDDELVWMMMSDLRKLRNNTGRVYAEAASAESRERPDYEEMLLNELRETLNEITELVQKYDEIQ